MAYWILKYLIFNKYQNSMQVVRQMEQITTDQDSQNIVEDKFNEPPTAIKKFFVFQCNFMLQFIKLAIYFLIASIIFGVFYHKNQIQMEEQRYFGQQKIAHVSQIRGLFPPVSGNPTSIYGQWRVTFTNSFEQDIKKDAYSEYLLQFKFNDHLRVRKNDCSGDLIMKWNLYSFNIYIAEYSLENPDSQMTIEPNPVDIQCIKGTGSFISNIKFVSIWSIYQGRLYFLIEKWSPQIQKVILEIVILEREKLLN